MGWMVRGLNPGRDKNFFSSPNRPERLQVPLSLHFSGYRGSFSGVKWPGRKFNHSPPSSAEVKNECSYTSTVAICSHGVDKENFTFVYKAQVGTRKKGTERNFTTPGSKCCARKLTWVQAVTA